MDFMATFPVDDVTPATQPLPTRPLGELTPHALVIGGDPSLPVLVPTGIHPLLDAVGQAFADHRPLILSPDAVWLTIAQGVAQHIRLHAGELRPLLVGHQGRRRLEVASGVPVDASGWAALVEAFGKALDAEADDRIGFDCDFTTSTEVDRIAAKVVRLDAYTPYFALWVKFVCGIPSITLTGTVEDWQKIRSRIGAIAELGLETWCDSLRPITEHFVFAAAGYPDPDFWKRIYSPVDAYGGSFVTGWISRLYPYLTGDGVADRPNEMLELPIGEPRDVAPDSRGFYQGPGISTESVPNTLSRVIVNVNDRVTRDNRVVALQAGLVGVGQDRDGSLRPLLGWHLTPAVVEIDAVIDRIVRDHTVTEPQPFNPWYAAADMIALYRRLGSAALFDNTWQILPFSEHRQVTIGSSHQDLITMIDLPAGRSIGALHDVESETVYWLVYRARRTSDPAVFELADEAAEVLVLGTSLALLLEAALDSDGEIEHLETARLASLIGRSE
jgi:hypothetical protein